MTTKRMLVCGPLALALVLIGWLAVRDEGARPPPPLVLAGRVTDLAMQPLAAELTLQWIAADAEPRRIGTARTDDDGRYRLTAPATDGDGVLVLMAGADDHETAGRRVDPARAAHDFVLVPGAGEVAVDVIDDTGPVPGAEVMLSIEPAAGDPDALIVATARAGADGRAVFARVTRGAALLHYSARAAGRGRAFGSQRKPLDETASVIVARLAPGAALAGRVVGADGAPIVDEIALAFGEDAGPWGDRAAARGAFRLTDVPTGSSMTVRVLADGYLLASGQDQMAFTVPAGARSHELVIAVQPAGMVTGRVTSRDGDAVEGATVEATPSDRTMAGRRVATTDADGRFRVGGLRLDAAWDLEVRHADFAPGFVERAQPARAGTETRVVLDAGGEIAGRVLVGAGPARDLEIYAHRTQRSGTVVAGLREHATARTGVDGTYLLEHLNPGSYRVEVRRAARMAWSPTAAQVFEVAVTDGDTARLDDAVLEPTGAVRVQLSVERDRAAGQTLEVSLMKAGAHGAPHQLTVQTGDAGDALLSDLEPGRYDLVARLPALGYARATVEVTAGATAIAGVAFTERISLEGRVRRPDGRPAAGATVDVYLTTAGSQPDHALPGRAPDNFTGNRALTDADGRFRIAGLDPGAADLRITLDGEAPLAHHLAVRPGLPALTLDLVRPATADIALLGADDKPLSDKVVLAQRTTAPHHVASAVTDATGHARFDRVPPGSYLVRAVATGTPRGSLSLDAGQAGQLVLRAGASSTVGTAP